jgi:hypothetical protein
LYLYDQQGNFITTIPHAGHSESGAEATVDGMEVFRALDLSGNDFVYSQYGLIMADKSTPLSLVDAMDLVGHYEGVSTTHFMLFTPEVGRSAVGVA